MRFIQQTALLVRKLHNDISCQIKYSGRLYSGTKLLEIRAYIPANISVLARYRNTVRYQFVFALYRYPVLALHRIANWLSIGPILAL